MKKVSFYFAGLSRFTLFVIALAVLTGVVGCNKDEDVTPTQDLRDEYEAIVEFAAVKQGVTYDMLAIFSEDYTTKFFEGGDLSYEEIDQIFAGLYSLKAYEQDVLQAASQLKQKARYGYLAKTVQSDGLGDKMAGFFNWLSGAGERSKERILTVASNMPENERTDLYNNLRPDWKNQAGSESEFWQKLENGDFNNAAPQMYNDFYHNAETTFPDLAQEKGLDIQKIVVKEGAEGIKKGGEFYVEVVKTVTPLGKGMDMVEKADEYKNKVVNLYEDPANAIKEEVKSAIADKIGGFIDVDGAIDAAGLSEEAGSALKFLSDYTLGSDDPAEWVKNAIGLGLSKVLDSDQNGDKADIVIAVKQGGDSEGPSLVISVDPTDDDMDIDDVIDIMLPFGEWLISAIDGDGVTDNVEAEVIEGGSTIVVVSTDPEGEHTIGQYALSVWISPGDPGPYEGVTVYAKINPADPDVEIFFSIEGTDGYSNQSTNLTDQNGTATFYIPGGAEDVRDAVVIRIVVSGLTRYINYTF